MKWLFIVCLVSGCHSALESCMPDAGGNCKCNTATDTVRDCFDKHGSPGIELCNSGMWTNCAVFSDGGNVVEPTD